MPFSHILKAQALIYAQRPTHFLLFSLIINYGKHYQTLISVILSFISNSHKLGTKLLKCKSRSTKLIILHKLLKHLRGPTRSYTSSHSVKEVLNSKHPKNFPKVIYLRVKKRTMLLSVLLKQVYPTTSSLSKSYLIILSYYSLNT